MPEKKALIAMSGGVDSSAAACLMQAAGFHCIGAMMHLHDILSTGDAQAVADRLGIPLHILDLTQEFSDCVIADFVENYESGLTPNPCVVCNKKLKFGVLLDTALDLGCDVIATGHYARTGYDEATGRHLLLKAENQAKDQSYFLYSLSQHQLAHTCFPLGSFSKEEARRIAAEKGLVTARKKDSQDICFIPDGDYMHFLENRREHPYPAGAFLDLDGNCVGQHRGAVAYTRGQRKGLGLALGSPVYVCSKDMKKNTVTIGPEEALFSTTLLAGDFNWIAIEKLDAPLRCRAKARSRMQEQPATVYPEENGLVKIVFDEPQRAITTGQAVVLYDADLVLGGGVICGV